MAGVVLSVSAFPVAYSVEFDEGAEVYLAAFLDDNGSGLELGPDTGDIVGLVGTPVVIPATGADVELNLVL